MESEREIHDKIQKALAEARKTPEYAEEGRELTKPTGECTCGNLGPEQGIPSPLCPVHKHEWDKPTGEWTVEDSVARFGTLTFGIEKRPELYRAIADAHNAALAQAYNAGMVAVQIELDRANAALAEAAPKLRQNLKDVCLERDNAQAAYRNELQAHAITEKQLAAEREKFPVLEAELKRLGHIETLYLEQLEQLAAERSKHESCVAWEDHNETLDELQKLRSQLAAEREKVDNATENCMTLTGMLVDERKEYAAWRITINDMIENTLSKP